MHQWHLFYLLGHSSSAERKPTDTHKSVQMLVLMQVVFVCGNTLLGRNPGPVQVKRKTPNSTESTYRCQWTVQSSGSLFGIKVSLHLLIY